MSVLSHRKRHKDEWYDLLSPEKKEHKHTHTPPCHSVPRGVSNLLTQGNLGPIFGLLTRLTVCLSFVLFSSGAHLSTIVGWVFFFNFCRRLGFGFGLGLDAWLENQDELRWLWGRRAEISSQFVCHGESTKKFVKLIRVVPLLVIGEGEDEMIWRFLERDNEYNFRGNFGEDILRAILFGSIRCVIN